MENSAYMEMIVASRAQKLTEQEQLEGTGMISVESDDEFVDSDVYTFCTEHFTLFMKYIRFLDKEQQELLLSYYMLAKTQNQLASLFNSTQTVCSFRLRMAMKIMGAFLMMGGKPSVEQMHEILERTGVENQVSVPVSQLIDEYRECRNFQRIAEVHKLHRPDIRRAMSVASKTLLAKDPDFTTDQYVPPESVALGAYIHGLIDKAAPTGVGKSKRQRAKATRFVRRCDPSILGEFRISVDDPGFKHWFVPRANR